MMQDDYTKWMERAKRLRTVLKVFLGNEELEEVIEESHGRGILTPNDVSFLRGIEVSDELEWPCRKPPLGVMPRDIWERKRQRELAEAMDRYLQAGKKISKEWLEEYNEISDRWGGKR